MKVRVERLMASIGGPPPSSFVNLFVHVQSAAEVGRRETVGGLADPTRSTK